MLSKKKVFLNPRRTIFWEVNPGCTGCGARARDVYMSTCQRPDHTYCGPCLARRQVNDACRCPGRDCGGRFPAAFQLHTLCAALSHVTIT